MPPKGRDNIRVVKKTVRIENVPEFVKQLAARIESGDLDSHLDLVYIAADERIRQLHGNRPDPEEVHKKLGSVMKLRGVDVENPEAGKRYRIRGESYRGVEVTFLGEAQAYENGNRKARVSVELAGDQSVSKLKPGSFVKVPLAALMELPAGEAAPEGSAVNDTQIQKI